MDEYKKPISVRLAEAENGKAWEILLRDLYGQGLTQREVAERLGMSLSSLRRNEGLAGVERDRSPRFRERELVG